MIHSLPRISIFGSLVKRFANDFNSWLRQMKRVRFHDSIWDNAIYWRIDVNINHTSYCMINCAALCSPLQGDVMCYCLRRPIFNIHTKGAVHGCLCWFYIHVQCRLTSRHHVIRGTGNDYANALAQLTEILTGGTVLSVTKSAIFGYEYAISS